MDAATHAKDLDVVSHRFSTVLREQLLVRFHLLSTTWKVDPTPTHEIYRLRDRTSLVGFDKRHA